MEDFASDVEDFMSGGAAPTIRDELERGPAAPPYTFSIGLGLLYSFAQRNERFSVWPGYHTE